jgi:hypothetical protein
MQGCGSIFIFSGSGSRVWGWRPIRIRIRIQSGSRALMTKNWKKITVEKYFIFFFLQKTAIYQSLGLHKVCPSYRRSLQLSKEAIQHFKTWTFTNFCLLLWVIFALRFRIRIRIHRPDWIRIQSGSTDPIESGSNPDQDPQPWVNGTPNIYEMCATSLSNVLGTVRSLI